MKTHLTSTAFSLIGDLARSLRYRDLISLAVGDPDYPTAPHIKEAAKRAMDEGKTHYTQDIGLAELRQAVADKLRRENGADYDLQNICILAGSMEGISVVSRALIDEGDEVLIPDPVFPFYQRNIELAGGRAVGIPLRESNGFQVTGEDVRRAISPRTKVILIVSPENPTGGVQSKEELKAIGEIATERNLTIWSDEIYEKFVYDGAKNVSPASIPGLRDRVITMGSVSKTYAMTGWRLGWVATPPEFFQAIRELHACTTTAASSISQYAALAALTGPQNSIDIMISDYARRRDYTVKRLNEMRGITVHKPRGTFYVFPDISGHTPDDVEFARALLKEVHVHTLPGSGFGGNGRGHLRISFAAPPNQLEEGLNRIEEFTRKLDSGSIRVARPDAS